MTVDGPALRAHYSRSQRRAMAQMARACGIDPEKYASTPDGTLQLWNAIAEQIAGGVPRVSAQVDGDPFAFFCTAICDNLEGHPVHEQFRMTAVIKTGRLVDQDEAEKMGAYLKAQENVNTCEICHQPITTWSMECTRVSVFAARPENANPHMARQLPG